MGWDAHAAYGETWVTFLIQGGPNFLITPHPLGLCDHFKSVFAEADKSTKERTGSSSIVSQGCLQVTGQRLMLEQATGQSCMDLGGKASEIIWSPRQVIEAQAEAKWGFAAPNEDTQNYWEARVFLETCAVNKLGIVYDW